MKHFEYIDYREHCPIAVEIEYAINDCGNAEQHLVKAKDILAKHNIDIEKFFFACISYWAKWAEEHIYDGRNKYACLVSKPIFDKFLADKVNDYDDEILINAFGFTMSAHRYLQCELFMAIRRWLLAEKENISFKDALLKLNI